jgi:hypothetical protein
MRKNPIWGKIREPIKMALPKYRQRESIGLLLFEFDYWRVN